MELLNYYSFFEIKDSQAFGEDCYAFANKLDLCGTVLVAPEGLNLALCGTKENLDTFLAEKVPAKLDTSLLRRKDVPKNVFKKLKLKVKPELVTSSFPTASATNEGTYLSPEDFHRLSAQEDTVLLDMRNDYEFAIGSFQGSHFLPLQEFSNLPKLTKYLEKIKGKKLLTFCTGGVRCEKAVPLLKEQGFSAFQLHGGILHYLEKFREKKDNIWYGECFVFDDRVSLTDKLEKGSYEWCERCGQPSRQGQCVSCS